MRNTIMYSRLLILFGVFVLLGASCQKITDGGVFKSEDSGETWQQKTFVGVQKKQIVSIGDVSVQGIFMDPTNPDVLYIGSHDTGIYKTETAGEQWRKLNLTVGRVPDIAIASDNVNMIYAAHQNTILKSIDGGEQWVIAYADPQGGIINNIELDWFTPQRLFATTSTGTILKSEDYGVTWTVIFETSEPLTQLIMSPHDSRILYALELDRNIYKSSDGGVSFYALFTPELQKNLETSLEISAIAPKQLTMDPNDNNILYIADTNGLFQSHDAGMHWEYIKTLIEKGAPQNTKIQNITIPYGKSNTILFTVGNQIYKTDDEGLTWKTITTFPSSQQITSILAHPTNSTILFAGVEQIEKPRRGLIAQ